MPEISIGVLMTLLIAINAPTWTMVIWILKVQRTSCERLSRMEGENSVAHSAIK